MAPKTIFNCVLTEEVFPESWAIGLIKPIAIYKKGDKKMPNNYRGITLQPLIGKIFTAISRDRVETWAEDNNRLNQGQFGFRSQKCTTDALFIITTIIEANKRKKKPIYACFVDFQKAFDTVDHSLLWTKLANMGLSDKMLCLLQSLYSRATSRVKVNSFLSDPFTCGKGVRQGCCISPLLYIYFVFE